MIICEDNNFIEIIAVDRVPDHLPTSGDTRFEIKVQSFEFAGQGWAWIGASRLTDFVEQLQNLELQRKGSAEIESMTRGQLWLRLWVTDSLGHVALIGRLQRRGSALGNVHCLEFGFSFSPDLLPNIVKDFEAIAKGNLQR